jgi:hypothetical protein
MDASDTSRVIGQAPRDLNKLGEFPAHMLATPGHDSKSCTLQVFADKIVIPETGFSLPYERVSDVLGGSYEELGESDIEAARSDGRILLIKYEDGRSKSKIAFSWDGEGTESIDYCEIMIYRAFAAYKVRSKNDGAPCYGIIGY